MSEMLQVNFTLPWRDSGGESFRRQLWTRPDLTNIYEMVAVAVIQENAYLVKKCGEIISFTLLNVINLNL
jgi:hypothetical protein